MRGSTAICLIQIRQILTIGCLERIIVDRVEEALSRGRLMVPARRMILATATAAFNGMTISILRTS